MDDLDIYNRSVTIYDNHGRACDVTQARHLDLDSGEEDKETPGMLRVTYAAEEWVEFQGRHEHGWMALRTRAEGYINADLYHELRDELAMRKRLRQRYGTVRPTSIADFWQRE